jgi:hypothetical protein
MSSGVDEMFSALDVGLPTVTSPFRLRDLITDDLNQGDDSHHPAEDSSWANISELLPSPLIHPEIEPRPNTIGNVRSNDKRCEAGSPPNVLEAQGSPGISGVTTESFCVPNTRTVSPPNSPPDSPTSGGNNNTGALGQFFLARGVPTQKLHEEYSKRFKLQGIKDHYLCWDDGGKSHDLRFTCIFVCPRNGELFASGSYGEEGSTSTTTDATTTTIWYKTKKLAEQAAAARAYDCLEFRYSTGAATRSQFLKGAPYTPGCGPALPSIPPEISQKIRTLQVHPNR